MNNKSAIKILLKVKDIINKKMEKVDIYEQHLLGLKKVNICNNIISRGGKLIK